MQFTPRVWPSYGLWRLNTTLVGSASRQLPVKPGLDQRIVVPPALPETAPWAAPLQKPQTRLMVAVIREESTVPEIVPVQTFVEIAQLPLKDSPTCVMLNATACVAHSSEAIVPLQLPAMRAGGGGVGAVGVSPPQAPRQSIASDAKALRRICSLLGRASWRKSSTLFPPLDPFQNGLPF